MKVTERLRKRFNDPQPLRFIGAHDALGARLGERAGFDGIWSNGFEISIGQDRGPYSV